MKFGLPREEPPRTSPLPGVFTTPTVKKSTENNGLPLGYAGLASVSTTVGTSLGTAAVPPYPLTNTNPLRRAAEGAIRE